VNTEIADAMKDGVDTVLIPSAKKTGEALEGAVKSVAHGAEHVAEHVETAEAGIVGDLEKAGGKQAEEVPVYVMKADGTVAKVEKDGSHHIIQKGEESSGIDDLLDGDGKILKEGRDKYPLGRETPGVQGPRVQSGEVAAGTGDLPEATLRARKFANDGSGNNYAAAKYDAEGKKFILVGHSDGPHSEAVIGVPFLRQGMEGGVTHLYTEREPCYVAQHFCGEWLHKYFGGTTVTHSFEYGESKASKRAGNKALADFLRSQGL
jgi:hypothetical protein